MSRPQRLGALLQSVIADLGIERRIDEARVVEMWAAIAGPQVNAVTQSVWMKGDRLYVRVTSAAWRNELYLRRSAWLRRLNDELKTSPVREIVFR
jgi:predicted nucleic acid-binding Zn ribbon protein